MKYCEHSIRLVIVGSGSDLYINNIKKLAQKEGVLSRITFAGYIEGSALWKIYKESNAFVFPTRNDCYGLVLVEAYCNGIPIVTSKYADGAYDIIENGINGIIIDPYNSKEFGAAINEVIKNKKYADMAIKNDLNRFDIRKEAEGFISVIKKMGKKSGK